MQIMQRIVGGKKYINTYFYEDEYIYEYFFKECGDI